MLSFSELYGFLEAKVEQYNNLSFVESDPVSVPHMFSSKKDIEIAGLLVAVISWGNRKSICKNGKEMMRRMDFDPFNFIMNAGEREYNCMQGFAHRTFNSSDLVFFMRSLKNLLIEFGSLEQAFMPGTKVLENKVKNSIIEFRNRFFNTEHPVRIEKHLSDPLKNASCKRINMFLRWMVRKDNKGVDFGLWKFLKPSDLMCPLDIHAGNVARKLGLLARQGNNWQAVEELTENLRRLDPLDPVKYDFALFGLGVFEKF